MICPICGAELELTPLNSISIQMERERGSNATHRADCPNNPYCPFSGELISSEENFLASIRPVGKYSAHVIIPAEIMRSLGLTLGDEVQITIKRL